MLGNNEGDLFTAHTLEGGGVDKETTDMGDK